jgi:hypothetical protein
MPVALTEFGRIDKTRQTLAYLDDVALVINPAVARSARSSVRTADLTDHCVTVLSAVRAVRGWPAR